MSSLVRLFVRKNSSITISNDVFWQNKRFAGHSKWQNIKHTKAEKDAEKSAMITAFVRKMRVAIAEGKSHKPLENLKLAQIIEEAKKKYVPVATITGVLERAEKAKTQVRTEYVDFRGPGGAIFLVKILSDNPITIKQNMNTVLKKTRCVLGDTKLRNVFDHRGIVVTDVHKDLDGATDDAIAVGAEEVEEFEDDGKFYRFICHPNNTPKIVTKLQSLNYNVISSDEEFTPTSTTQISEEDSIAVDLLYKKLNAIDEVVAIHHNIEFTEEQKLKTMKN